MKVYIGPYPGEGDEGEQEIDVHIDKWDTWSMDNTLAHIILPMLKQLKETRHGAPYVDNEDVPETLWSDHSDYEQTDENFHKRWDWVLDEMIWAFEQKTIDWEEQYYEFAENHEFGDEPLRWEDEKMEAHQTRMSNGFRLFGKYYENLWD